MRFTDNYMSGLGIGDGQFGYAGSTGSLMVSSGFNGALAKAAFLGELEIGCLIDGNRILNGMGKRMLDFEIGRPG